MYIPGLRYEIVRDGSVLAITDGISHFDDTLLPNVQQFVYAVITIDANGRRSTATTITLDRDPISMPPRGIGILNSSNYLGVLSYVFDPIERQTPSFSRACVQGGVVANVRAEL